MVSATIRAAIIPLVILSMVMAAQQPQTPAPEKLNLVVVEGDGAINNLRQRTSRETIVQVEDENHKPVAGAAVVFLLPGDGPGGAFADGAKSATVVTDSNGQAAMPRFTPNSNKGNFRIRIHASQQGLVADTTITQSVAVAAAGGISGGTIALIVVGVVAAGVAGGVLATRSGSNSSNPSAPSVPALTGTISAGTGTVFGPPH